MHKHTCDTSDDLLAGTDGRSELADDDDDVHAWPDRRSTVRR
jgi:hypothetical protein